jgi:phosphoglycolate phosphatase
VTYELCLFDLDGTLTDPKEGITKSVQYALKYFGIDEPDRDALTRFIGPPLRESFAKYRNFSEADTERAILKYREYFSGRGIFENKLYPGITDLLTELRHAGVRMAIATSKPAVFAEKIAKHFAIDSFFEAVTGSELDGSRGTKGEVIGFCLDTLDPNRGLHTVMIGDREYDIFGARETSIDSIGVLWGYGPREELESANAARIVNSPEELCRLILGRD